MVTVTFAEVDTHYGTHQPGELRKRTTDLPGKKVIDRSTNENVNEESFTRQATAFTYTGVVLAVERVEKCAVDQVGGPNH